MQLSPISLAITRLGRTAGFSPANLFAAGEQGAWYDPSDFSTMFQDAAGTTPVTAVEQPVGLILDKSKGLVLGPELTDGNFVVGTGGTVISPVAGGFTMTSPTGGYGSAKDVISIPGGKYYVCEFDYVRGATVATGLRVCLGWGTENVVQTDISTTTGHKKVILRSHDSGNTNFTVQFIDGTTGATGTFTNFTVKELPGNHASQSTTTKRPILRQDAGGKYYLAFDGVDDSLSTAAIDFTSTDNMSAWMGVLPSASTGFIVSSGLNPDAEPGSIRYDLATGSKFNYQLRGVSSRSIKSTVDGFSFPSKNVNYGSLQMGTVSEIISRVNGSARSLTDLQTTNPVVGPFGNLAMHIGRRGDNAFPYTGNIYSLIVLGRTATAAEITATEAWVNGKTGAWT